MPEYFSKFQAVISIASADAGGTTTVRSAKSLLEEAVQLAMHEMSADEVTALVAGAVASMGASLSKPRRKAGDKVFIDDGDGFGASAGAYIIQEARGPLGSCPLCGNLACQEWPVLAAVDAAGAITRQNAYHVSECSMHDQPVG